MEGLNKEKVDGVIDDPEADRFCFADQMEFVMYAGHCKKLGQTKNVIWENKSTYQDLFMQGCAGKEYKEEWRKKVADAVKDSFDDYILILKYLWQVVEKNTLYKALITKESLCVGFDGKVVPIVLNALISDKY